MALLGVLVVTSEAKRAHACCVCGCFTDGPLGLRYAHNTGVPGARSTSVSCQTFGDATAGVTSSYILARLQGASLIDEPAEKLYKLSHGLGSKPSRERYGASGAVESAW